MSAPPITIPGTEVHTLHSDIVGDDYEISVVPPPPIFGTGPFPVVYVLDGNLQIGRAVADARQLMAGGEIGPVYVVGIGYPRGADPAVSFPLRNRDLTPSRNDDLAARTAGRWGLQLQDVPTGGGAEFLGFLTGELRPFLAEQYSIADTSTIFGQSLAATFAVWALFRQTDAFQRYVIVSPMPMGDDDPARWEAEYAAAHSDLDARVFLASGADEGIPGPFAPADLAAQFSQNQPECTRLTRELGHTLESRQYPNLCLETHIVPGMTHFTIPGFAFPQGLRYVFAPA